MRAPPAPTLQDVLVSHPGTSTQHAPSAGTIATPDDFLAAAAVLATDETHDLSRRRGMIARVTRKWHKLWHRRAPPSSSSRRANNQNSEPSSLRPRAGRQQKQLLAQQTSNQSTVNPGSQLVPFRTPPDASPSSHPQSSVSPTATQPPRYENDYQPSQFALPYNTVTHPTQSTGHSTTNQNNNDNSNVGYTIAPVQSQVILSLERELRAEREVHQMALERAADDDLLDELTVSSASRRVRQVGAREDDDTLLLLPRIASVSFTDDNNNTSSTSSASTPLNPRFSSGVLHHQYSSHRPGGHQQKSGTKKVRPLPRVSALMPMRSVNAPVEVGASAIGESSSPRGNRENFTKHYDSYEFEEESENEYDDVDDGDESESETESESESESEYNENGDEISGRTNDEQLQIRGSSAFQDNFANDDDDFMVDNNVDDEDSLEVDEVDDEVDDLFDGGVEGEVEVDDEVEVDEFGVGGEVVVEEIEVGEEVEAGDDDVQVHRLGDGDSPRGKYRLPRVPVQRMPITRLPTGLSKHDVEREMKLAVVEIASDDGESDSNDQSDSKKVMGVASSSTMARNEDGTALPEQGANDGGGSVLSRMSPGINKKDRSQDEGLSSLKVGNSFNGRTRSDAHDIRTIGVNSKPFTRRSCSTLQHQSVSLPTTCKSTLGVRILASTSANRPSGIPLPNITLNNLNNFNRTRDICQREDMFYQPLSSETIISTSSTSPPPQTPTHPAAILPSAAMPPRGQGRRNGANINIIAPPTFRYQVCNNNNNGVGGGGISLAAPSGFLGVERRSESSSSSSTLETKTRGMVLSSGSSSTGCPYRAPPLPPALPPVPVIPTRQEIALFEDDYLSFQGFQSGSSKSADFGNSSNYSGSNYHGSGNGGGYGRGYGGMGGLLRSKRISSVTDSHSDESLDETGRVTLRSDSVARRQKGRSGRLPLLLRKWSALEEPVV